MNECIYNISCISSAVNERNAQQSKKAEHVGAADTCSVLTDPSTLGFVYPHALAMLIVISVADK